MTVGAREQQFDDALRALFPLWRSCASLAQGRVPQLINRHTAVGAAKHLLHGPGLSNGFVKLRDARRLDLTIEWLVLRPEFGSLFTMEERAIARRKLVENGVARSELRLEPYP